MSHECPAKCSEALSTSTSPFNSVQLGVKSPANCGYAATECIATPTSVQSLLLCACVCHSGSLCVCHCVCERHRQLPECPRPPLATVTSAGCRALGTSSHSHLHLVPTMPIASNCHSMEPSGTTARLSAPACPLRLQRPSRSDPSSQRAAPAPTAAPVPATVTATDAHVHVHEPSRRESRHRQRWPSRPQPQPQPQSRSRSPAARKVRQAAWVGAALRNTIRLVDVDADVSDPATHEVLAFIDHHSRHASTLSLLCLCSCGRRAAHSSHAPYSPHQVYCLGDE